MDKPKTFPKTAKRVYQGQNFDIWQWPQKMFDGSTRTFERAVQIGGVSILASVGNKIIVLKQQQPGTPWYYGVPGGAMDIPGEKPKQTAIRELLEETGYKPGSIKLWKALIKKGRRFYERHIFIASDCERIAEQSTDIGEKIELQLMTYDKLLKFCEHPDFFKDDVYFELLKAKADKNYKNSLKQALSGKSSAKTKK